MVQIFKFLLNVWHSFANGERLPSINHSERERLLGQVEAKVRTESFESFLEDIRDHGDRYQTECSFIYCIDREGRIAAHSISCGLHGADLRQQLNGEPLVVLEKILDGRMSRPKGHVHYHLNPRLRVEMSYQTFGEFIVIAQSKLIPSRPG